MSKSFSNLINSSKPTLVDFYATWCGPCKTMSPILDELKVKIGDKASVIKVDVDKNPAAAAKFQVRGVPKLILFKNGEVKWRQSGVVAANDLKSLISKYL